MKFESVLSSLMVIVLLGCPAVSCGQDHVVVPARELSTTQLMRQTKELLEYSRMAEAIPYLEEALVRFSELKGAGFVKTRAEAMYQLGLCYLENEQFLPAFETFQTFLSEYADHTYAMASRIMALEALARLKDSTQMTAYIDQLQHRGNFKKLIAALKDPANADTCRNALVSLMKSYARQADLTHFKQFLPYCDADVLSDLGLNYAVLEGGDLALDQGRHLEALEWFRQVKTSPELIAAFDRRLKVLKTELDAPQKWVAQKQRNRKQVQREAELQRYDRMLAERKGLEENRYDLDLMLRMAQCYDAMGRHGIAIPVYRLLYQDYPESHLAERCRYFAFNALLVTRAFDEARDEGESYTEHYPQGRFYDEVTLGLMHVEIGSEQLDAAENLGRSLLVKAPEHRYLDQVNYLLGFVRFQLEDYETALPFFAEAATVWPDRMYAEESTYWVGMCTLFLGRFEQAVERFEHYLTKSSWSPKAFSEDVTYRLGMAYYGLEDDEKAKSVFKGFLGQFPESDLVSEAHSILGDLYGVQGELDVALEHYAKARKSAINSTQLDYAVFQAARALELMGAHKQIIAWMTDYLEPSDRQGRFAEAGAWLSRAWRAVGDSEKALEACCDVLVRYGNDPQADGFGALVEELLGLIRDPERGERLLARARQMLTPVREKAVQTEDSKTLSLYLTVLFAEWSDGDERTVYLDSLMAESSFEAFAPLHLLRFAEVAAERHEPQRVRQAYDYFVASFTASDQAVKMANIGIAAFIEGEDYPAALALAQTMIEDYPAEPAVAQTHKLAGDSLRLLERYEDAIEMYSQLYKVRAWRGPLTPEGLYWTAVCHQLKGDAEKAFAYFQRVYVLYGQYPEWIARAYAGSAECLRELGREEELVRTWREMVAIPAIANRPEVRQAQAALNALAGGEQ